MIIGKTDENEFGDITKDGTVDVCDLVALNNMLNNNA